MVGKIDEFKQDLIEKGLTEGDFEELGKLLRRVKSNFLKRQHCYTTAIQFPAERAEQAVALIKYGLENFEDGWFSTYTSYLFIGKTYEKINDYQKAYDYFLLAKNVLGTEHSEYIKHISKELFWMKLHIDSFAYSEEMEGYYLTFSQSDDFDKSFLNNELKLEIANIVVSLHYGKTDEARRSLERVNKICRPDYKSRLHNILARHNFYEALNITREAIAFINSLKI